MSDWKNLKQGDETLGKIVRTLTLLGAVGLGLFLGWRLFLAPEADTRPLTDQQPQNVITQPAASKTAIPVELTGTVVPSLGSAVRVGDPAPDFELPDLKGQTQRLSEYLGRTVVINFWTTWCPPCREEMPALQQAFEKFQDQGFVVLAVNWTAADDKDQIGPYVQELGLTFPILLDTESQVSEGLFSVLGLPTSVFVGRDGKVREVFIGPIPLDTLEAKIQILLEESP